MVVAVVVVVAVAFAAPMVVVMMVAVFLSRGIGGTATSSTSRLVSPTLAALTNVPSALIVATVAAVLPLFLLFCIDFGLALAACRCGLILHLAFELVAPLFHLRAHPIMHAALLVDLFGDFKRWVLGRDEVRLMNHAKVVPKVPILIRGGGGGRWRWGRWWCI